MEIISSLSNPKIKYFYSLKNKNTSIQEGLFLLEGKHNIEQAIKKDLVSSILVLNENDFNDFSDRILINQKILDKLKSLKTNKDYIAISKYPENIFYNEILNPNYKKIVLLDNIQDPGNVGTIIRSSYALGHDAIVLFNNCSSWNNLKVITSTQGAIFSIPIYVIDNLKYINPQFNYFLFTLNKNSKSLSEVIASRIDYSNQVLVFGNESKGLDIDFYKKNLSKFENVFIEISKLDSLNVASAASIALYLFK